MISEPALRLDGVAASYGGPDVVRDISLEVRAGEIVTVLGFNGAGKSTIFRAIARLIRLTAGSITVNGENTSRLMPHQVVMKGVTQIPQGRRLFGYMTGYENLKVGAYIRRDRKQVERDISDFVDRWPVALRVLNRKAQLMSGGEQQVIAVGRALMSRPKVLLLDEPSMGLAPILVDSLYEMLRTIVTDVGADGQRMAVLLIEQNVEKALQIADQAHILVAGRLVHSSKANEVSPEDVVNLYLAAEMRRGRDWIQS